MLKLLIKLFPAIVVACLIASCLPSRPSPTIHLTISAKATENDANMHAELTKIVGEDATPIPTAAINSDNWLQRWLSSPTCQPPCWENIIPGQTSYNIALRTISNIPGVNIESIYLTPVLLDNTISIKWDFGNTGSGFLRANYYQGRIVSSMELIPKGQVLTIGALNNSFGNPDSIITTGCFGEFFTVLCPYVLLYKEWGMVAYLEAVENKGPINVEATTEIVYVSLSPKDNIRIFDNPQARLIEIGWDGYKTYKFTRGE